MEQALHNRIPRWEAIRNITGQPGISVGVIHQGREVLNYHAGVIDFDTNKKPNGDTLYCIASLSKALMAASIDMLVREGETSWDTPVHSIIPEFRHTHKTAELKGMTLRDICSHRTGLLSLDEITQGLDGRILIDKKEVVKVCNAMPVKHELRSSFLYNNGLFELAGHVVERLSGYSTWGVFQHERIYEPLGMNRTRAFRDDDEIDDNFAQPYMILTDGTPSYIPSTELSVDSMNGGSGGVRSSLNDLLKWSRCLLASFDKALPEMVASSGGLLHRLVPSSNSCQIGANFAKSNPHFPVLGAASPSLLVYGHQGDVPGNTCNIYIIPETNSAVVVLANGTGHSDATDWIAQDIIQTISELKPEVDFLSVAKEASRLYLSHYTRDFRDPLERNRGAKSPLPPLGDFVGTYVMEDLDVVFICVSLVPNSGIMRMRINGHDDQAMVLNYYNDDVFSYLPDSYDECLKRGLDRTHWSAFLIHFLRDEQGRVKGCRWELDGVDTLFTRK
ncbi:beta-lactamase/transpeptidase-like protein [Rhypophila decipiens]|uniref:Beta-lactamase/transpeptidase-like protein n=1 Tax=Rhypophila decipiens TaxID=261697 RepID=A0AAN6Y1F6_9PEZI|nr:beta-lactamase/transpeptidase-like protein [Rhypophila decipiens]